MMKAKLTMVTRTNAILQVVFLMTLSPSQIRNYNLGDIFTKLKNKRMGISSIERYYSHELYPVQTRN